MPCMFVCRVMLAPDESTPWLINRRGSHGCGESDFHQVLEEPAQISKLGLINVKSFWETHGHPWLIHGFKGKPFQKERTRKRPNKKSRTS